MSNSASHAALPYVIKNARFSIPVPYLDADGDPTDPTTPDTEVSKDGGAFADCAEEVTTISGSNGFGYLTLTGAETDCSLLCVAAKVASGPKATLLYGSPRVLATVGTGTLSAGSAGGGTLGTLLAYDVTGCFLKTTGGTGGGGTGGANNQARRIVTYNTSTGAITVAPDWETTPDNTTTYAVLLPEGVTLGMLRALNPTTAGRTLDVSATGEAGLDWANVGSPTTTQNLSGTTLGLTAAAVDAVADAVDNNQTGTDAQSAANNTAQLLTALGTPNVDLLTDLLAEIDTRLASADYTAPDNSTLGDVLTAAEAIQTILAGITSLAAWLGALAGKTADATTRAEIQATTAGASYDETTDSLQAQQDNPPSVTVDAQDVRDAMKLAPSAGDAADGSIDDQLADLADGLASAGGVAGPGADAVTVNLKVAGVAVPDADVWVSSDADGNTVVAGTLQTGASGNVTFMLDAGSTYYLWAQKDGYNLPQGESFTAVADS